MFQLWSKNSFFFHHSAKYGIVKLVSTIRFEIGTFNVANSITFYCIYLLSSINHTNWNELSTNVLHMICNCNLPFIKQNYQKNIWPYTSTLNIWTKTQICQNLILSDSFDSIEIHATPYFIWLHHISISKNLDYHTFILDHCIQEFLVLNFTRSWRLRKIEIVSINT